MLAKLKVLPTSLKAVVWLNIMLAILPLIRCITSIGGAPDRAIIDSFSAIFSALVVMGILQKSTCVRGFALGLAWLSIGSGGLIFFISIFAAICAPHHNWLLAAKIMAIPLAISGVIAWGLMTKKSKIYFGIISDEEN